jgi:hypothetical protein
MAMRRSLVAQGVAAAAGALLSVIGCSASNKTAESNGSGAPSGSLSGGAGGSAPLLGGSNEGALPGSTALLVDSGRPPVCDDAGHCTCIHIASLGQQGTWGGSTAALMNWLSTESSAGVDVVAARPAVIDAAFLAKYDVIILQLMAGWTFAPAEIAAVQDWVTAGGGIISLTGYTSNPDEVDPLNQWLSFTDISYNKVAYAGYCPPTVVNCACWDNTVPIGPWAAGPIGQNITSIPSQNGYTINPGAAAVDATYQGAVVAVHEAFGKGHIFVWSDEWVTYSSQWLASPAGTTAACAGMTAADVFQVPQFWFNAISYASLATQCQFVLNNPNIVMPR